MKYNWPDRFKLIVVYIILNVIIGMFITIALVSLDLTKSHLPSFSRAYASGYILSVLITIPILLHYWKQLRRQENAGELPDMNDMRNISPRQMIYLAIGFPLFIGGYVLFQFGYKQLAVLSYIGYVVIWGLESAYVRTRAKRILEKKELQSLITEADSSKSSKN